VNELRGRAYSPPLQGGETQTCKIGVPDNVLLKPGALAAAEFAWIRKHPEWGWMALHNVNGFQDSEAFQHLSDYFTSSAASA